MTTNHTGRKTKAAKRNRESRASDPTRDKLLEVAEQVFADRGYQAATIREIFVRAGANVAAVNYHFGDKLRLYTEVLQQSVRAAQKDAALFRQRDRTNPRVRFSRSIFVGSLAGVKDDTRPSGAHRRPYCRFLTRLSPGIPPAS